MSSSTFLVHLKDPDRPFLLRVAACNAAMFDDQLCFTDSQGRLVALFTLEIVQSVDEVKSVSDHYEVGGRDDEEIHVERRILSVLPDYVDALGRAVHYFSYLEWEAVLVIETLKHGYVYEVPGKTSETIAEDLRDCVDRAPGLQPELRARLVTFSGGFKTHLESRNKLVLGNPFIAGANGKFDWAVSEINETNRLFEIASVEASALQGICRQTTETQ